MSNDYDDEQRHKQTIEDELNRTHGTEAYDHFQNSADQRIADDILKEHEKNLELKALKDYDDEQRHKQMIEDELNRTYGTEAYNHFHSIADQHIADDVLKEHKNKYALEHAYDPTAYWHDWWNNRRYSSADEDIGRRDFNDRKRQEVIAHSNYKPSFFDNKWSLVNGDSLFWADPYIQDERNKYYKATDPDYVENKLLDQPHEYAREHPGAKGRTWLEYEGIYNRDVEDAKEQQEREQKEKEREQKEKEREESEYQRTHRTWLEYLENKPHSHSEEQPRTWHDFWLGNKAKKQQGGGKRKNCKPGTRRSSKGKCRKTCKSGKRRNPKTHRCRSKK